MVDIYKHSSPKVKQSVQSVNIQRNNFVPSMVNHQKRKKRLDSLLIGFLKERSKSSYNNPFTSFGYYPEGVSFINKDPEEDIILYLRRHPITNLKWVIFSFFLLVLPGYLSVLPIFVRLPLGFQIVLGLVWYLVIVAYILEKLLGWFYHVNILTDERIIEVDFMNLIYREITDANIDQIQDVTVKVGGGIRTIFNYGDVQVQTAAGIPEIYFEAVPHPDMVAKILRDLRVEEEREKMEGRVR